MPVLQCSVDSSKQKGRATNYPTARLQIRFLSLERGPLCNDKMSETYLGTVLGRTYTVQYVVAVSVGFGGEVREGKDNIDMEEWHE